MPNAKQPIGRYALAAMAVALVAFLLWYFASIVTYVLVAAVLSLMGKPIVRWLSALHINKWLIPKWLAAAVALAVIGSIFFAFFRLFIPLIVRQYNELRKSTYMRCSTPTPTKSMPYNAGYKAICPMARAILSCEPT